MIVLAIETSTVHGSVAIADASGVLREERFHSDRGHNTAIFGPLERVLGEAGGEIARIAVGTGPGSYSGVRVGIAVASALGAVFGAREAGISSLLAPAGMTAEKYTVIGDARRKSFFLARVRRGALSGEIELVSEAELARQVAALLEEGEPVITFDGTAPELGEGIVIPVDAPSASVLAMRAAGMSPWEFEALAGEPLQPVYLRAPYITTPKER